jgi:hypothetical protein
MPSFSDFAGFEGFLFCSVDAKGALATRPWCRAFARRYPLKPRSGLSNKNRPLGAADTIERSE